MAELPDDRNLADLWRAGDQQAARRIVDDYAGRLLAVARRRLGRCLAARLDPEDVVQSVFRTFFSRLQAGRLRVEHGDDLLRLLVRITVLKTLQQVRRNLAEKRNPRREESQGSGPGAIGRVLDRATAMDVTVAFLDQLEHFLRRLRPEERQILQLRREGYSNEEIARLLGTYDRKVRRIVERIRGLAEQEELFLWGVRPAKKPQSTD